MNQKVINIVITGPESAGKSVLSQQLADHYHTLYIPEYARDYIGGLGRKYCEADLVHIAQKQIEEKEKYSHIANRILFLDTFLIITKIWFEEVYHFCPVWLDRSLRESDIDLFLLCNTDLEWVPDPLRENGGERREYLFKRYEQELKHYNFHYGIVKGTNEERLRNAIRIVEKFV